MAALSGQKILLGVTGGIAAYKACELVRELKSRGADVRVVMTDGAQQFVTALTFQALSGQPVHRELFDLEEESAMGHITLARWPDQIVIAPASANFMARLAHGMADDLLSTLCLATRTPITLAPAMNQGMWMNPATQQNVERLRGHGHFILGPAEGAQACGEIGPGRMLEPHLIADHLSERECQVSLAGLRILITAGPTREPIDPVRYLTNRSSGRMGYAIAEAAKAAGANVTLVSGPTSLPTPQGVIRHDVETAHEMHHEVMQHTENTDIFIGTAAVSDYAPEAHPEKMKKSGSSMSLSLHPTPDILADVSRLKNPPFTVGFAAETQDVETYARQKLKEKRLDLIAANQVGRGLGFDTEDNALLVLWPEGQQQLERTTKRHLARQLITLIAAHYHAKHPAQDS